MKPSVSDFFLLLLLETKVLAGELLDGEVFLSRRRLRSKLEFEASLGLGLSSNVLFTRIILFENETNYLNWTSIILLQC